MDVCTEHFRTQKYNWWKHSNIISRNRPFQSQPLKFFECVYKKHKKLWDRVLCEIIISIVFYLMIRVSDCDFTADKISVFMMIHHVLYSKICTISLFFVIDIFPLFSNFWPTNNHVQYHVNCGSLTGSFRSSTRYALTSGLFSYQFLVMSSCCFTLAPHRWLLDFSFVLT